MTQIEAGALQPGMWVWVPALFTEPVEIADVTDSGYQNRNGDRILTVRYVEGAVNRFGAVTAGNSTSESSLWDVAEQCSANTGGNPANGCENWVPYDCADSGLCNKHWSTLVNQQWKHARDV